MRGEPKAAEPPATATPAIPGGPRHYVNGARPGELLQAGLERAGFGMGCFWGAERLFWQLGVACTAVGYAGGTTPHPGYREVCSGGSGHAEVVLVVFDPAQHGYATLLRTFWEGHDPTQGMRQGNDRGTQYRSLIHVHGLRQRAAAEESRARYQEALYRAGYGAITTEILEATPFHYAEDEHQQYLAKHPNGYCGLGGTGVSLAAATPVAAAVHHAG